MKNPILNLTAVACIMLLSSCEKEDVINSDVKPNDAPHLELRCCTEGDIADVLSNPNYLSLFGNFQTGLIEPGLLLINALDEEYLTSMFDQLEACVAEGSDPLSCLENFSELLFVKNYIDGFNDFLLDSLRNDYSNLDEEDFGILLGTALMGSIIDEDMRHLPCFIRYQEDLVRTGFDLIGNLIATTRTIAAWRLIRDLSMARMRFCSCMFNNYGTKC